MKINKQFIKNQAFCSSPKSSLFEEPGEKFNFDYYEIENQFIEPDYS